MHSNMPVIKKYLLGIGKANTVAGYLQVCEARYNRASLGMNWIHNFGILPRFWYVRDMDPYRTLEKGSGQIQSCAGLINLTRCLAGSRPGAAPDNKQQIELWQVFEVLLNSSKKLCNTFALLCLKVTPNHMPMLAVPCGHSICDPCCRVDSSCPVCHCHVESRTYNVMLQQIVANYQRHLVNGSENNATPKKAYQSQSYTDRKS